MAEVEGTVTLDGNPLEHGSVRFVPVDGKGVTGGATIDKGRFHTRLPLATYQVEMSAVKSGGTPKNKYIDEGIVDIELIPAKYRLGTELTLEVTQDTKDANFDLKSH